MESTVIVLLASALMPIYIFLGLFPIWLFVSFVYVAHQWGKKKKDLKDVMWKSALLPIKISVVISIGIVGVGAILAFIK